MKKENFGFLAVVAFVQISGCVTFDPNRNPEKFASLERDAKSIPSKEGAQIVSNSSTESAMETRLEKIPQAKIDFSQAQNTEEESYGFIDPKRKISANFRNMPLPEFIHETLNKELGIDYVLDPKLNQNEDLVTLSLTNPLYPAEFLRTLKSVLTEYGVVIRRESGILKVDIDKNAAVSEKPLIVTGGALPSIPATHRPVFASYALRVLRPPQVKATMLQLYKGTELVVGDMPDMNSIILRGPADLVREAIGALKSLDKPLLLGKNSISFRPDFIEASNLTKALLRILVTEGYAATDAPPFGSIIILPFDDQQRILIFANDQEVLNHVISWAKNIDSDQREAIDDGFFSYEAENITAEHIAEIVSALMGQGQVATRSSASSASKTDAVGGMAARSSTKIAQYLEGRLVLDGGRNVLFFKGSGKEWSRLKDLIEKVDQPVPMVLIDVMLVEVTLSDGEDSGIEWLFKGGVGDDYGVRGSTRGGLGLKGSGMSLVIDSAGETRAIINAFYQSDKASIRSSPKLLVKSGETARIEVGNEIPILTSNAQSFNNSDSPIIQSVEYRKTGVLLNISPIVQASGLVDLVISQELSEQQSIGAVGSPIILNRSLETALAIKDGGSILLGGLISDTQADGRKGLPMLSKIPVVGKLFSVDSKSSGQTELMMLVSTFVLKTNDRAVEITESLRERFDF